MSYAWECLVISIGDRGLCESINRALIADVLRAGGLAASISDHDPRGGSADQASVLAKMIAVWDAVIVVPYARFGAQ